MTSRPFRDDAKLGAAAVADSVHIRIGARADAVAKFRRALDRTGEQVMYRRVIPLC